MLPSLSRLPVGAPGPVELERDFTHMYLLRSTNDEIPEPLGVINGRVLNVRGDPEHIMDEAERWRRKQLERMHRRRASGTDRLPTHRTSPIPPVAWEEGVEVLADGALVNVLASTLNVPEASVPVASARAAARDATGRSSAELAQAVTAISNTDGGATLGWWAFVARIRRAVPGLRTTGVMWLIGALYALYRLKEEAEQEQYAYWPDWNSYPTASARHPRLDRAVIITKNVY